MLNFSSYNQRFGLMSPRGVCAPDDISKHGNKEFASTNHNSTTPVSIPLEFQSFVPDNQPSIYSSEQSGDFALRGTKKVNNTRFLECSLSDSISLNKSIKNFL